MKKFLLSIFLLLLVSSAHAEKVEFSGKPYLKIHLSDLSKLNEENRKEYRVSIIERDKKYYWVSRENKEMSKFASGAITTYSALDGSGTVIVTHEPAMAICLEKDICFNYTENIRIGLSYISYLGLGE